MTLPLAALVAIPLLLLAIWAVAAWRHRPPKPPEPTPWADSTKVAHEVREKEAADDGH